MLTLLAPVHVILRAAIAPVAAGQVSPDQQSPGESPKGWRLIALYPSFSLPLSMFLPTFSFFLFPRYPFLTLHTRTLPPLPSSFLPLKCHIVRCICSDLVYICRFLSTICFFLGWISRGLFLTFHISFSTLLLYHLRRDSCRSPLYICSALLLICVYVFLRE